MTCVCGHPEPEHYERGDERVCYHCPCARYDEMSEDDREAAALLAEIVRDWE